MKAISPALPMTTPARQSNGADASAAADAFSALIAAVIGAPVTGSTPAPAATSSSQSSTRVDRADDARPAAATAHAESSPATADGTAKSSADATRSPDPSAVTDAPQPTTHPSATSHAGSAESAPSPKPDPSSAGSKPATAMSAPGQPTLPVGLEKAAAALAQALAASSQDTTTVTSSKALPTQAAVPATKPGSALTEGQLPAQLVVATHSAGTSADTPTITQKTKTADPVLGVDGKPVAIEANQPTPATPAGTPQPAGTAAAQALASAQVAKPRASSDVVAVNPSVAVTASTTGDHRKSEPKTTATPDRPSSGDVTPHVDVPLPAQPMAPTAPLVTSVGPAQQAQPAYTSGMVSQQLVQVVAPLRTAKDGDYTLSLQLHPADLGSVTVRVDVQQGVLSVHMSAEHAHGHEALNQSLADLRTQLQASGVRTGDIIVAAKQPAMPQHQDQQQHTGGRHQPEAPAYDDAGGDRRPGGRPSQPAQSQADDDTLDVRI